MLYHFRVMHRSSDPFEKAKYEPDIIKRDLGLDDEAVAYMTRIAHLLKDQGKSLAANCRKFINCSTKLRRTTGWVSSVQFRKAE